MPTDYFTPISNAVAQLRPSTASARRAIYDQARQLIEDEARNGNPPMGVSELIQEQRGLERAIQAVESRAVFREDAQLREQEERERAAIESQTRERTARAREIADRAERMRAKEMRAIEAGQRRVERKRQRSDPRRPPAGYRNMALIAGAVAGVLLLGGTAAWLAFSGWPASQTVEQQTPPAETPPQPAPEQQAAAARQLMQQASQSLERGDALGAIKLLNDAVALTPSDFNVYTLRGHAYLQGNDIDRSIEDFSEAIRLGSRDFYAFVGRGVAYRRKRDYPRAIADYDEAIRIRPEHAGAWNNRCFVHAVSGNLDTALSDCNEALRLTPNEPNALDSRALVYLKLKQYDRAVADYDAVLKAAPNTPSALYGRGLAKIRKGDKRGQADISTATAAVPQIVEEFKRYGID